MAISMIRSFSTIWTAVVAFTLMSPAACSASEVSLPAGWRIPAQAETSNNQEWRNREPNRFLTIVADFNGDGVPDRAMLLVRIKDSALGLFAFVSVEGKTLKSYLLDEATDKDRLEVMGIAVAKPGKYATACGKGYFDCRAPEPDSITLEHPAVDYFKEEGANSFFYWDKASKGFKRAWMSD